jgi:hypothetical protein
VKIVFACVRSDAAVIHGPDQVTVTTLDLPEIGREELLLRVVSSSMCL